MIFRQETALNVVLGYVMRHGEVCGAEISTMGFIGSAAMYPALMRLEHEGWLQSRWEDGPPPRRRLYSIKAEKAK